MQEGKFGLAVYRLGCVLGLQYLGQQIMVRISSYGRYNQPVSARPLDSLAFRFVERQAVM